MSESAKLRAAVAGLILLSCVATHSGAHPFQIDQVSLGVPLGGTGISAESGNVVGQEFTPTFSALDVVDIGLGPHDPSSFGLRVNIRAGSLDGPILGTSLPGVIQAMPPMQPFFHFDFASLVPLVPGNLYVIQPILVQPTAPVGFPVLEPGPYAGGRVVLFGTAREDLDLIFRTGLSIPEPAPAPLLGLGIACAYSKVRRSPSRRSP